MAIFRYLLSVLFVRLGIIAVAVVAARSSQDGCHPARCTADGPPIKYPFWLKSGHPECCGYPEFELSCNDHNQTLLQLLPSVKLQVIQIDYKFHRIQASAGLDSSSSCLPRQLLNLNFSPSPFWEESYQTDLYNCSPPQRGEDKDIPGTWVPCLSSVPGYRVYAMEWYDDVASYLWTSCTKIGTIAGDLHDYNYEQNYTNATYYITWLKPDSRNCDAEGIFCSSRTTLCKHNRQGAIHKLKHAGILEDPSTCLA